MKKLKTINIRGKEYVQVNTRIAEFRNLYPEGSILTEILSNENGVCVMKATVINDGKILAIGHAYEKEGSSNVNSTSYLENCETSAIGRCLGILGIGIDGSVATAEEVETAIIQQEEQTLTDEEIVDVKQTLLKAKDDGNLKSVYQSLNPYVKEKVRDFVNELRKNGRGDAIL